MQIVRRGRPHVGGLSGGLFEVLALLIAMAVPAAAEPAE